MGCQGVSGGVRGVEAGGCQGGRGDGPAYDRYNKTFFMKMSVTPRPPLHTDTNRLCVQSKSVGARIPLTRSHREAS